MKQPTRDGRAARHCQSATSELTQRVAKLIFSTNRKENEKVKKTSALTYTFLYEILLYVRNYSLQVRKPLPGYIVFYRDVSL